MNGKGEPKRLAGTFHRTQLSAPSCLNVGVKAIVRSLGAIALGGTGVAVFAAGSSLAIVSVVAANQSLETTALGQVMLADTGYIFGAVLLLSALSGLLLIYISSGLVEKSLGHSIRVLQEFGGWSYRRLLIMRLSASVVAGVFACVGCALVVNPAAPSVLMINLSGLSTLQLVVAFALIGMVVFWAGLARSTR